VDLTVSAHALPQHTLLGIAISFNFKSEHTLSAPRTEALSTRQAYCSHG
jgi:hypothetical protein